MLSIFHRRNQQLNMFHKKEELLNMFNKKRRSSTIFNRKESRKEPNIKLLKDKLFINPSNNKFNRSSNQLFRAELNMSNNHKKLFN